MPEQVKAASSAQLPSPKLPPDEKFWVRYSPHHEAPLSGMTSLFLHGLVVGLMLIVGSLMSLRWHGEADKPPRMQLAMIEGGPAGDGPEGLGGPAGLPGQDEQRTELAPSTATPDTPSPKIQSGELQLENAPSVDLLLPDVSPMPAEPKDLIGELDMLTKQANQTSAVKKSAGGGNNPKGVGGRGGAGDAPGPGRGKRGTGTGGGGPAGATKAQIFAWRWRFDLSGDGKLHAEKLAAVGVTLALLDVRGQYWVIRDLDKRPVDMRRENMQQYKDAVKWYNTKQDSVFALARELQLPFVPQHVVLLLPKEREQKMAAAEAEFARHERRDLNAVQATWFDFRVQGGDFEPVVIKME
jgi:hypothetical protein